MDVRVVMDADCLIKLTRAGAKGVVLSAMEVAIPARVRQEVVDEGKRGGHADAFLVEENLARGHLRAEDPEPPGRSVGWGIQGGEGGALGLFHAGGFDAIASDDARFLRKLDALGVPFLTAAACLVRAGLSPSVGATRAGALLDALRPFISEDEYAVARLSLEVAR